MSKQSWEGNLRKMTTNQPDSSPSITYHLPLHDRTDPCFNLSPNDWIGHDVEIQWLHEIHCVETGKRIQKTYGDGLSYNAWLNSPASVESVIRPELSRIHEGIALRDEAWEREHHLTPHVVYLSYTGGLKVGVTRLANIPFRWHDQGAVGAIVVAEVPYRQLAGQMEVELKPIFGDKTNWRSMLQHQNPDMSTLLETKDEALESLDPEFEPFFSDDDSVWTVTYPVLAYPEKVKSCRLEKREHIQGKLNGIKGQYFIFESGEVINVRNHMGYRVRIIVD